MQTGILVFESKPEGNVIMVSIRLLSINHLFSFAKRPPLKRKDSENTVISFPLLLKE